MPLSGARLVRLSNELPPAPKSLDESNQHISGRVAVSSAANFLLVFLLRLNHVLAPAIVNIFRVRRDSWIERVTDDVEAELRRDPNSRQLCAGLCCQSSYGTFDRASPDATPPASVMLWVQAVAAATDIGTRTAEEIAAAADYVEDVLTGDAKPHSGVQSEAEIYFTLRVQQEARHRSRKTLRVLDEELVLVYLTLFTVILYSSAIIAGVQYWYRLDLWELGVFSLALVTTAFLAEGGTLKKAWRRMFGSVRCEAAGCGYDQHRAGVTRVTYLPSVTDVSGCILSQNAGSHRSEWEVRLYMSSRVIATHATSSLLEQAAARVQTQIINLIVQHNMGSMLVERRRLRARRWATPSPRGAVQLEHAGLISPSDRLIYCSNKLASFLMIDFKSIAVRIILQDLPAQLFQTFVEKLHVLRSRH
ncbi:hypothetical protein FGB62_58g120 [Gracilaria domingensis]|nr:hypothetical protein FGB62_58g120 [Gracilaria domingensis]